MLFSSFQSWLRHEVEVLVSVGQARQTLENLIDDRKLLSRQLAELRNQVEDEDNEPAAKVLTTLCVCVCVYLSVRVICLTLCQACFSLFYFFSVYFYFLFIFSFIRLLEWLQMLTLLKKQLKTYLFRKAYDI